MLVAAGAHIRRYGARAGAGMSMAVRRRSLPRSLPAARQAGGTALSSPDEAPRAGHTRGDLPALWPLIIIFSPVIVLAGESVNRYVMRRVRRSASTAQIPVVRHGGRAARAAAVRLPLRTSLLLTVISNPLWIALTAPGRWVSDRFRRHPPRGRTGERTLTARLPATAALLQVLASWLALTFISSSRNLAGSSRCGV